MDMMCELGNLHGPVFPLAAVEEQRGPQGATSLPPGAVTELPAEVATGSAPFALTGNHGTAQHSSNGSK